MSHDESKRPKVGVAVVIWQGGKILMLKRHGSHGAGTWSIPGGHLEYEESWEACAKREVMEEVGINITNIRFFAATNDIFADEGKHFISIWVECDLVSGEPKIMEPHKILDLQWCTLQDLPVPLFEPCWRNLRAIRPELFQ